MPAPRVDWEQIKGAWLADDRRIAIIDQRAIHLILSLLPRLDWKATYDGQQIADTDWDYIQRIVADAEYELGVAMPVSELIPYFDEVEDLLRALQFTANCCDNPGDPSDGEEYTDSVTDGVGNVPPNVVSAGYATDSADWAGFDDYKCMIAHVMIDNLEGRLRWLAPYLDSALIIIGGIGTLVGIITTLVTAGGSAILLSILAATGSAASLYLLLGALTSEGMEAIADDINDNQDELACAIYNADGSDGALIALEDKIDELFDAATAEILKLFNLGPTLKALYSGRYDAQNVAQRLADKGYDVLSYDCTCAPTPQDADVYAIAFDCTGANLRAVDYKRLQCQWNNEPNIVYQTSLNWNDEAELTPYVFSAGQGSTHDDGTFTIDSVLSYSGTQWREYNNRFQIAAVRNNAQSTTMAFDLSNFKAWLSEDGGVTGTWYDIDITNIVSNDSHWSYDLEANTLSFSRSGTGTYTEVIRFEFLILIP